MRRLVTSSVLLLDAVLAASALLGAADGLPDPLRPGLLLRANDLVLTATHLRNVEAERQAARLQSRSLRFTRSLKNRSADYYQNWYIQTAGFPNGVSNFIVCASPARKPQRFKSPPPRPRPSARISSEHHDALGEYSPNFNGELARFAMIPWTTQEISLLIGLWPHASAAQISKQLNRSRASVCGKAMRLRRDDLLPADVEKHFEVNPAVQTRPGRAQTTVTSITPAKPTPPVDATCAAAGNAALLAASNSMTANAAGRSATCTRSRRSSAAVMRCQGLPIAGIICGWRDTTAVCHPITVHTGLAEVPVGLPRIRYRWAENKHAYARRAQVDRTASRQPENHGCD